MCICRKKKVLKAQKNSAKVVNLRIFKKIGNTSEINRKTDFPGDPVVRVLCFQSRGHESNPWSGN